MARLIVAPLGEQIGGVLWPLVSPPLRPDSEDVVSLAVSELIRQRGLDRIATDELRRRFPGVRLEPVDCEGSLEREKLETLAENREVWLLVNGGLRTTIREITDVFWPQLRFAASRDGSSLRIIDPDGTQAAHEIEPVAIEALQRVLGVRLSEDAELTSGGEARLRGVVDLRASRGFLFAAVDPLRWPAVRAAEQRAEGQQLPRRGRPDLMQDAALDEYRGSILNYRQLQRVGLEQRRVFLMASPLEHLRRRALQDGVPVDTNELGLTEWRAKVDEGTAFDLPEQQQGVPFRRKRLARLENPDGEWTGEPLVVFVGPQPGMTLQAIWRVRPSTLYLVYDFAHPVSYSHARRLLSATEFEELRCRAVEPVRVDRLNRFEPHEDKVHVDLSAGDKITTTLLDVWRREEPDRRCLLEPQRRTPVPLRPWLRLYAPPGADALDSPLEHDEERNRVARALLTDVSRLLDPPRGLDDLRGRRQPPRIVGNELILGSNGRYDLDSWGVSAGAWDGGKWLDWCVATVLAAAGIDEVVPSYRVFWPDQHERQRDELDVVTRCGAQFTLWSAKTTSNLGDLGRHFADARGQADRLVGRQQQAVLVIPRLRSPHESWPHPHCRPIRRDRSLVGYYVDVDFLLDKPELRRLAAGEYRQDASPRSD